VKARRPPLSAQEIRVLAFLILGALILLVYERAARAGEDPFLLNMPFHLLVLYFPLALIPDPIMARSVWLALTEIALLGLAYLSLRLTEWEPPRLFLVPFFLLACLSFYAFEALIDGGPQILLGLIYLAILFAVRAGQDQLLGGLLVLAAFKWEIGGLFLLLVLLRLIYEQRWAALASFGMIEIVLLVISFLVYPGWLLSILRATWAGIRAYGGMTAGGALMGIWPEAGARLGWGMTALLLIVLGIEWATARSRDFRRLYWAACLTLAATPLIGFRTETANLVVLLPAFTLFLAVAFERWRTAGYALSIALLVLVFAFPWTMVLRGRLFAQPVDGLLFLFYPVLTFLGLYWTRWWAIHPPRIWMDQVVPSVKK